jgi:shikimate dehydrogenase
MKDNFHLNTKIIGLFAHPVKHTYSPYIHNLTFQLKGLDYIYLPFDVTNANLKNAIKGILSLGIKGFNVTIPHKENIMSFLDNISEEASIIGSVNTVVNDIGKLVGYNTDVNGILETLSPFTKQINGENVTLVGAGGAARAVIFCLVRNFKPKQINLVNRTEERAYSVKEYFKAKMKYDDFKVFELVPPDIVEVFQDSKLIINATPIGMYPDTDDTVTTLKESFKKGQITFDLVYNPVKTKFLEIAESQGATTLDGLNMLVYQAAESFKLWTGQEMPIEDIIKSLQLYIKN